ncbi:DUF3592 domain-containing protein [Nocardioides sp. AX2bis]|uniref:DUF3592 domain-containing protein n=1 Tax=Nocardioides sp. AX2bis TaxID=2653157 RepID=UPI0012F31442|nr:DUF3592 domain-containing protein [Nocardioides sp. AX2bis]VXC06988.1 conserved hypothetical protein [Nocardioides sp. AX2bis]
MTPEPWFLLLAAVLWLAIVAGWVWWVRGRLRRRRRLRSWPRVSAEVRKASAKNESVTVGDQTQRYTVFEGRYEFTDPAGRTQRGEHRSRTVLRKGDLVEVMHDPEDPSSHEPVAGATAVWVALALLVLYTLGVGLFAVLTTALGLGLD